MDRLANVKNYQCTKIRAKQGEDLLLFKQKYGQRQRETVS